MATKSMSVEGDSFGMRIQKLSLSRPILMCVLLFLIALFIRLIDSLVFRLDEILGELILTKSLGFVLVLAFLWVTGHRVKTIGLHTSFLGQSLLIGVLTTGVAFCVGYGVEMLMAAQKGIQPGIQFIAIDSKLGVTGGFLFTLWLLFCNFVNSFMEEGLFRGVMGRLSRVRFDLWKANWFQAFMFSIWHLPWVLKYYMVGEIKTGGDLATQVFFNSIPQLLIGIVYGYFYLKTNSLWAPWIAHALSNTVLNFFHVTTMEGMDPGFPIRMAVYTVVMLLSLFWVRRIAEKNQMEIVKPWK